MNKVNRYVAVIAVGLLVPAVNYANSASSKTADVARILESGFKPTSSLSEQDIDEKLKQFRTQLQEQGVLDSKEQVWLDKVGKAREEVDKAKAAESLPSITLTAIDKARLRKNQELERLFPQLQTVPSGVNAADLTSNEKSCPADFSQYKAMSEFLASDSVKMMQQQGQKFLEDAEKDKGKMVANLAKLAADFKRKAREKFEKEQAGFADQQAAASLPKGIVASQLAQKERIEALKAKEQDLKSEKFKRETSFVDELFTKLIPALAERAKGINAVRTVANMISSRLQQYRQHSFNAAFAKSQELAQICQENLDEMRQGSSSTGISLLQTAVEAAFAKNDEVAPLFQDSAVKAVSRLRCREASQELEASLGESSPMKQQIDALAQVTDAGSLLQNVMNFLPQINASLGALNSPLKNSIQDCIKSAKMKESIVSFINRQQNSSARTASSRGNGGQSSFTQSRRRPSDNALAGSPTTHRGGIAQ